MLVGLLNGDEMAPIYVLRLWAHCQNRKGWVFTLPAAGLLGICRAPGDAAAFESAMEQSGFVKRVDDQIEAVGWAEFNASLIAAWSNGNKGGRPRKAETQESSETHGLSQGVTHGLTDKIRVDKTNNLSGITKAVAARGTRLPKDWAPSDEEILFCKQTRPDLRWQDVALQFRDYWVAKAGKDGAKADWPATWRNWVRRQNAARSPPGYRDANAETIAALTGANRERDDRTIDV